jgi:hypothetical protein
MNAEEFRALGPVVDVSLWNSSFVQYRDHLEFLSLRPEARRVVRRCESYVLGNSINGHEKPMLRVFCEFGIRAFGDEVNPKSEPTPSDVVQGRAADASAAETDDLVFHIEATLVVLFELRRDFEKKDMDLFFVNCCTHMAWPFWRQHVFDVVKRANLPDVPIPIFCPPAKGKQKKKSLEREE